MIAAELYDQARERIAQGGFTAALQTKIALVLMAAKSGNLAFQGALRWVPSLGVAQQFLISQAAREAEAIALLTRTTQWFCAPPTMAASWRITAPLLTAWAGILQPPGPAMNPHAAWRGLSLGHAQFARIRLAPIVPDNADPLAPFVMALARIEQENARMLQTQIRLLKAVGGNLPLAEREERIEADQALVDGVMTDFLGWLAAADADTRYALPAAPLSTWRLPWPASPPAPSP